MSIVIATAADAAFFDFVQGTVRSIRDKPQGQSVSIGMLDLGCNQQQRGWLAEHGVLVCEPRWHYTFPLGANVPVVYRGLCERPFLREYFSGFDVYLWIDADGWVQDWTAVELLSGGAGKRGLAIVPECSRGNCTRLGDVEGLFRVMASWYASHFDEPLARRLANFPLLNAGVFALTVDAPHWQPWAEWLARGLQRSCSNLADQLALNVVVREGGLRDATEILPPTCNWMCHCGLPAWDPDRRLLVDPYLPHDPVGILHLSGEKQLAPSLECTRGPRQNVSLRYPPS